MSKASAPKQTETMRMLTGHKDQICKSIAFAQTAEQVITLTNQLKSVNDAIENIAPDLDAIAEHEAGKPKDPE